MPGAATVMWPTLSDRCAGGSAIGGSAAAMAITVSFRRRKAIRAARMTFQFPIA